MNSEVFSHKSRFIFISSAWTLDIFRGTDFQLGHVDPQIPPEKLLKWTSSCHWSHYCYRTTDRKLVIDERNWKRMIDWMAESKILPSFALWKGGSILTWFVTTWLFEAGFSVSNDLLPKKRNLLPIEKKGDLCLKLNQGLEVQLDELSDRHQEQWGH